MRRKQRSCSRKWGSFRQRRPPWWAEWAGRRHQLTVAQCLLSRTLPSELVKRVRAGGWMGPGRVLRDGTSPWFNAGADIIVDDIYWSNELNFQQGPVSQAIESVKARGVTYFSSSGNNNGVKRSPTSQPGITGYPIGRHQSNVFVGTSCPEWLVLPQGTSRGGVDCLDFSPNGIGQPLGKYTMGAQLPSSIAQVMHWAEPANGLKTNLQLQMYGTRSVTGPGGVVSQERCLGAASSSDGVGLPVHYAQWDWGRDATCNPSRSVDFVVVRDISRPGYGSPTVQITPFAADTNTLAWDREFYRTEGNNTIQGSQYGHNGDGSAASVAAAPWTAPTVVQSYSSLGANQTRFGPSSRNGVAPTLSAPVNPEVPTIMGLDGIVNSFFGSPIQTGANTGLYAFYGTSAASPTAAAVAALGLEKNPTMRHDQVVSLMRRSANAQVANPYSVVPIPHSSTCLLNTVTRSHSWWHGGREPKGGAAIEICPEGDSDQEG